MPPRRLGRFRDAHKAVLDPGGELESGMTTRGSPAACGEVVHYPCFRDYTIHPLEGNSTFPLTNGLICKTLLPIMFKI